MKPQDAAATRTRATVSSPGPAGTAYDCELIGALRDEFNLEDYDAEAAAKAAAKDVPALRKLARQMIAEAEQENQP